MCCAIQKRHGTATSQNQSTNHDSTHGSGQANGSKINEKMAAFDIGRGHIDDDVNEAPDAFCCPITHVSCLLGCPVPEPP